MRTLGATIPESSTCTHISSEYSECQVQTMCSLCISTGTCEFDVVSLSCGMKSATINSTTYCSSNDTVCSTCDATAADPICRGEDSTCICQTLCSVIQPLDTSDCISAEESIIAYTGIAIGMICVASFVFVLVKCRRRYLAVARQRSLEAQHRRESELLRMRQPQLALNLIGWRNTVELNKPELHKLGACCYVMKQEEVATVEVDELEPSTSLGTNSTFNESESPCSYRETAVAFSPTSNEQENECDYCAMDKCSDTVRQGDDEAR